MKFRTIHSWDVSPSAAVEMQRELAKQVVEKHRPASIRHIAGADISHNRFSNHLFAGVVVLSYPDLKVVETRGASGHSTFPYRTGLLSFREVPLLLEAFRGVKTPVDVVLLDGQGRAHPRRLGLACHVGLALDLPAIGVAKTRLVGEWDEPAIEAGSQSELRIGVEVVGTMLRTKRAVKPLFISVGNRSSLDWAGEFVQSCVRRHRIPEPTRLAHEAVNALRRAGQTASST